jgi:hypothetical protein
MKELPPFQCPRCFVRLDRTEELSGDAFPSPGDINVCLHCGGIGMFTDDLQLITCPDDKITIEAVAISIVYYKPIITVWVDDKNGKIH